MIFGLQHRASVTNIMQDNGIMTIGQLNKLELCTGCLKSNQTQILITSRY